MDTFAPSGTQESQVILKQEIRNSVAIITLNRPAARNSLSLEMIAALHGAIDESGRSSAIAAIIITGAPPMFCAGHDLKEMAARRQDEDKGRAFFELTMRSCSAMMEAIVRCPKPVIAAVSGVATAAGCQLVASCDLAVAAENAKFSTPGVNIGLFCSTPMVALSRNVSRKAAMEMLLLGDMIAAEKAKEIGLVNRLVPDGNVLEEAMKLGVAIASKSPLTLAIGKQAFYRQLEMPLHEAYLHCGNHGRKYACARC